MSQRFSAADVAAHKSANDLYIIVDEDVYDLTKFQEEHPGGKKSVYIVLGLLRQADRFSPPARCWQRCFQAILEVPQ